MKHSSPALIRIEPRGRAEKKKQKKTEQKQKKNLLQWKHTGLTSFRRPALLIDHNFFLQLL